MLFLFHTKTRSIDYFISFFVKCELLLSFVNVLFRLFLLFGWCFVLCVDHKRPNRYLFTRFLICSLATIFCHFVSSSLTLFYSLSRLCHTTCTMKVKTCLLTPTLNLFSQRKMAKAKMIKYFSCGLCSYNYFWADFWRYELWNNTFGKHSTKSWLAVFVPQNIHLHDMCMSCSFFFCLLSRFQRLISLFYIYDIRICQYVYNVLYTVYKWNRNTRVYFAPFLEGYLQCE